MDSSLLLQLATLVVAVAGVTGGLLTLHQGNRQQLLELGNLYIKRYWEIDDDLLILPKGSAEHKRARHRYLRLCEDEFEAATRRWLDKKQWIVWHEWLTRQRAQERLREDLSLYSSDLADFHRLQRCLSSGVGHSWSACQGREVATRYLHEHRSKAASTHSAPAAQLLQVDGREEDSSGEQIPATEDPASAARAEMVVEADPEGK